MGESKPKKPQYQAPQYTQLSLPELKSALTKFTDQGEKFGDIQNTIASSASGYLDALDKLRPGYKAGIDKAQQTADSFAQGLFPSDVAQKISQSSAFKGLTQGLGSQQRQQVEARDFGRTSMDIMGQGLAMQGALRNETAGYMPLQALNLAFTPQAIRQEDVTLANYNNRIQNQQAEANANVYNKQQDSNYAYDQQYGGSPWSALGGGVGGAAIGAGIGTMIMPGAGTLIGAGLGASMGGSIGGSFGGAQGQEMGSIFRGIGSNVAGFGGMGLGGAGFGGAASQGFDYLSQAQQAAPYAGGYSSTPYGWAPRAAPVQNSRRSASGVDLRSGW